MGKATKLSKMTKLDLDIRHHMEVEKFIDSESKRNSRLIEKLRNNTMKNEIKNSEQNAKDNEFDMELL